MRTNRLGPSSVFAVVCAAGIIAGCDTTLKIDPADQACASTDECILTMVKCSCDCGLPINRANWLKYLDAQKQMCADYDGRMCKMDCGNIVLECRDGVCAMKP